MAFKDDLKSAMGKMTISELSRRSNVPISTIWRHLQGENLPTLGVLERYKRALPRLKLSVAVAGAPARRARRRSS